MVVVPSRSTSLELKGNFSFTANPKGMNCITDSYQIKISVPREFPAAIPTVIETNKKIPRDGKHHVNSDGSLCLGSPLRLLQILSQNPCLVGFAEKCLVPYLYSVSKKIQSDGCFEFGELRHGKQGIIDDYMNLFGVSTQTQVMHTLKLIGMKRRVANKKTCPCNCTRRLGKCSFRRKINSLRKMAPRSWFKAQTRELETMK